MKYLIKAFFMLIILFQVAINAQDVSDSFYTSINGIILNADANPAAMISSKSQNYWCTYTINSATDEMRKLSDLKFYEGDKLLFAMPNIPGSDLEISNSGKIIFYDHSEHYKGLLKILVYSKEGRFLFDKSFEGATQFEFSRRGERIGVRTPEGISVISLHSGRSYVVEKGLQFAIEESANGDGELVAVAPAGHIFIYENSLPRRNFLTGIDLPRKILLSSRLNLVAIIDKRHLKVYSLTDSDLLFEKTISGKFSFRDLKIVDDKIMAGIHKRDRNESTGVLRIYELNGDLVKEETGESKPLKKFERANPVRLNQGNYDPIPWPFFPFDSMRTVWNHYEQHMGLGGTDSYLHQGLDLICPIGEPTYSVIDGYVKCVLTTGGSIYWRIAISDTQISGRSNGWLSAHLIQNTIQFDVGDTVQVHDYLGDIIQWTSNWGHIHLAQISDSGSVWFYSDNEWGINFDPALAITPYPDTTPPYIDPVFGWSKFAFARNESAIYLDPDSLYGDIDIIVKVVDYAGDSNWQQPAFSTWYTIKKVSDGQIIKPKTLGHILNHKYPFYNSMWYHDYAGVIYQRDNTLPPSSWTDMNRNFYHNLTNSNGDSLIELSEKALAFPTDNYPDDLYRIIVEVYDDAGNFDIDSMDVHFKNGNIVKIEEEAKTYSFSLGQNYPNPFNPKTVIHYKIPLLGGDERGGLITLKVYDILGNEITTLVNEKKAPGEYKVEFDASHLSSGIYLYRLTAGSFSQTRKMILLK